MSTSVICVHSAQKSLHFCGKRLTHQSVKTLYAPGPRQYVLAHFNPRTPTQDSLP